ncbi:hypothetical protein F5890DRAFT_1523113 [Lentinula detonsa]|uniref:Uncharacterized protein n=1 Tax=Lentinula detonsa TaxID=2804962 RepID=A0AA38PX75_9AGAR|nr:hypothetical protein F5890DRAFT_1523113 [Lentinula detonsa]
MSPAPMAYTEPSTSTAHTTNSYTIYHTHSTLTSVWTIIALSFIAVGVSGVFCYSIYSCYQTAAYQRHLEITKSIRQRKRAESRARKDLATNDELNDEYLEAKRSAINSERSNSVTSFQSSPRMPDINSPPLAVTYPTHTTPYMIHASPISPLPCTEYEPVKLSPGPPAPMFFDSNSIPFYITEMPRSPLINSKLAPVAGSFITISNDPADISSPLASDTSMSNTTELAKVTAFCPRPRSTSARLSRTRAGSLVDENCDPFSRAAPSTSSVILDTGNSDSPGEPVGMLHLQNQDIKQPPKTSTGKSHSTSANRAHDARSTRQERSRSRCHDHHATLRSQAKVRKRTKSKRPLQDIRTQNRCHEKGEQVRLINEGNPSFL